MLERPTKTALAACRMALFGTDGKDPKLEGAAKHMFDNGDDLVALNPPVGKDLLSKFLRRNWIFPGNVWCFSFTDPRESAANRERRLESTMLKKASGTSKSVLLFGLLTFAVS